MSGSDGWSREAYEDSVCSRCWAFTPYDAGWDDCVALSGDRELREIVQMEQSLGGVPAQAEKVVGRAIAFPPFCPHYAFPRPYLEVLDAIGRGAPPDFVHGCYTADAGRKRRLRDYIFCLDAWLAGVGPEQAAKELEAGGSAEVDWPVVCESIWQVLGEHGELKDLLVERVLHRQRWWLKSLVWDNDARDRYCRDRYLGDVKCRGDHYGNPEFADPYFAELEVPRVRRMEARLAGICPDWPWFRRAIHDSWLCGPKAFRFLERLLWSIGKGRPAVSLPDHPVPEADVVPGFLQCEDTYPVRAEAEGWLKSFMHGMRSWVFGGSPDGPVEEDVFRRLGAKSPVKLWLVRLYARRLELLDPYGAFTGRDGA